MRNRPLLSDKNNAHPLPAAIPNVGSVVAEPARTAWFSLLGLIVLGISGVVYLQIRVLDRSLLMGLGEMFGLACVFLPLWLGISRAVVLGKYRAMNLWRWITLMLGVLLFISGLQVSLYYPLTSSPMIYFSLGSFFILAFVMGPNSPWSWELNSYLGQVPSIRQSLKGLPMAFCLVALGIPILAVWGKSQFPVMNAEQGTDWLFYLRGGQANDIQTKVFSQYHALAPAFAYAAFTISIAIWLAIYKVKTWKWLLFLLMAAMAGKFFMAALSTQGLAVLPLKVSSINSDYLDTVSRLERKGVTAAEYTKQYRRYQLEQESGHARTKPPGAVLFFWGLKYVSGGSPWIVALWIMGLTSLTVVPLFFLAKRVWGAEYFGVAAALLYLSSPSSLILSGANIDPIITFVFAFSLWAFVEGLIQDRWALIVIAGILMFCGTLMTSATVIHLVYLSLCAVVLGWQRTKNIMAWFFWVFMRVALLILSAGLAYWIFWLWTGKQFDYLLVVKVASKIHHFIMQFRPFDFWSWGGVLLFSGYLGISMAALLVYEIGHSLWNISVKNTLLVIAVPLMLGLFLWGYVNSECQRIYQFGTLYMVLAAAGVLAPKVCDDINRVRYRWGTLFSCVFLGFLSAIIMQVFVADFW
jgi:hypothetical protein